MKTLVIGATGTVGSSVVAGLLAKGQDVRVLSRNEENAKKLGKVEAFVGDLTNPHAVKGAFEGVDSVFMLNAVSTTELHEGLVGVSSAAAAGVRRFVYMGVHHAAQIPRAPHFAAKVAIESAIRSTKMNWTFLQPNNFFQNDYWFKDVITQFGVYPQPIGDKGLHRVDTRDIADAAVNALTGSGFENKAYSLVGPTAHNGHATAELYSAALGKKINYGGNDLDAWEKQVLAMMPGWMVWDMKEMYASFQEHGLLATAQEIAECEKVVGHPLRTFDAFVKETTATWK